MGLVFRFPSSSHDFCLTLSLIAGGGHSAEYSLTGASFHGKLPCGKPARAPSEAAKELASCRLSLFGGQLLSLGGFRQSGCEFLRGHHRCPAGEELFHQAGMKPGIGIDAAIRDHDQSIIGVTCLQKCR